MGICIYILDWMCRNTNFLKGWEWVSLPTWSHTLSLQIFVGRYPLVSLISLGERPIRQIWARLPKMYTDSPYSPASNLHWYLHCRKHQTTTTPFHFSDSSDILFLPCIMLTWPWWPLFVTVGKECSFVTIQLNLQECSGKYACTSQHVHSPKVGTHCLSFSSRKNLVYGIEQNSVYGHSYETTKSLASLQAHNDRTQYHKLDRVGYHFGKPYSLAWMSSPWSSIKLGAWNVAMRLKFNKVEGQLKVTKYMANDKFMIT